MRLTRYTLTGELSEQRKAKMQEELMLLDLVLQHAFAQMDDRLVQQNVLADGDIFVLQDSNDAVLAVAYRCAECFWLAGHPASAGDILKAVSKQGYGFHRFEVRTADKAMAKAAEKAGFRKVGVLRLGGFRNGAPVDTFLLDRVLGEQEHGVWWSKYVSFGRSAISAAAGAMERYCKPGARAMAVQHADAADAAGASSTTSASRAG